MEQNNGNNNSLWTASSSFATTPIRLANGSLSFVRGLQFNLADNMEQCYQALTQSGLPVVHHPSFNADDDATPWCNATWDTVLCWPATPGGQSVSLQCPPLKGLDPTKTITKFCHSSGRWMGKSENDFTRPHGWTNFSLCFTNEVIAIMQQLDNGTLQQAQEVAKTARKLEFVGLGLSLVCLLFSVLIFSCFRRLRVFRNMLHLHLMVALLAVVLIRLVLYIDLIFTDRLGHQQLVNPQGKTINTMVVVCELMFFLLEYFKSVAFWWMFLEGLYMHNQLVFAVFNTTPRLWPYLCAGYGIPLIHTTGWLIVLLIKKGGKLERCLGSYYLETEFWILDGPRLAQLVLNSFFIFNVIRVLWLKVRDSQGTSSSHHGGGEIDRMKKSVKAALMLIPLLGIPNIMQTIPFSPTHDNITYFAIWTYCASFTYFFQGFMIAIIYCFTNREVQSVLKHCYTRYRLSHFRGLERHRGSHYTQIAPTSQIRSSSSVGIANGLGAGDKETMHCNGGGGRNSCITAVDYLMPPPSPISRLACNDDDIARDEQTANGTSPQSREPLENGCFHFGPFAKMPSPQHMRITQNGKNDDGEDINVNNNNNSGNSVVMRANGHCVAATTKKYSNDEVQHKQFAARLPPTLSQPISLKMENDVLDEQQLEFIDNTIFGSITSNNSPNIALLKKTPQDYQGHVENVLQKQTATC